MVSNHKVFGHQMNVCISGEKSHLLVGSDVVLTRHILMTSFPAARKNVKSSSDIIMSSYPVNAPTCSGTALLKKKILL